MTTKINRHTEGRQHCRTTTSQTSTRLGHTPMATATRSYFRWLRAAEMAAWEMTGGDYVLARFAVPSYMAASPLEGKCV